MEPAIIINGSRLTSAQSLAVRMAISELYMRACTDPHAIGKDDLGTSFTQTYKDRSREILEIMAETKPEPPKPINQRSRRLIKTITLATHA